MNVIVDFFSKAISTGETSVLIFAILIGFILFLLWERKYDSDKRRELSESQKSLHDDIRSAYDVLKEDNERLRSQLVQLQDNQAEFERQVKEAITIGFDEIKRSMENLTLNDLVAQVPENLRKDIQNETLNAMNNAWKLSIEQINAQLPTTLWGMLRRTNTNRNDNTGHHSQEAE